MTITPEQFAKKLDLLSGELKRPAPRTGVRKAGQIAFASLQAQIAADIGPERKMSGLGNKRIRAAGGGPVSARLRLAGTGTESTAWIGPGGKGSAGAFGILEGGTVSHIVGAGRNKSYLRDGTRKVRLSGEIKNGRAVLLSGRRASRRDLLLTPWGPRFGPWRVSGSPAKRTVTKGWYRVRSKALSQVTGSTSDAIRKAFR